MTAENKSGYLSKKAVAAGNISSKTPLVSEGLVSGDVRCERKAAVTGKATGQIDSADIDIAGLIDGNVTAAKTVFIAANAVVTGDVTADSVAVDGAVFGNIFAKSEMKLSFIAKVTGDIEAKSLALDGGAVIDGHLKIGAKKMAEEYAAIQKVKKAFHSDKKIATSKKDTEQKAVQNSEPISQDNATAEKAAVKPEKKKSAAKKGGEKQSKQKMEAAQMAAPQSREAQLKAAVDKLKSQKEKQK